MIVSTSMSKLVAVLLKLGEGEIYGLPFQSMAQVFGGVVSTETWEGVFFDVGLS